MSEFFALAANGSANAAPMGRSVAPSGMASSAKGKAEGGRGEGAAVLVAAALICRFSNPPFLCFPPLRRLSFVPLPCQTAPTTQSTTSTTSIAAFHTPYRVLRERSLPLTLLIYLDKELLTSLKAT